MSGTLRRQLARDRMEAGLRRGRPRSSVLLDRGSLRGRERGPGAGRCRPPEGDDRRARYSVRIQSFLRQGQSHLARELPRGPGSRQGLKALAKVRSQKSASMPVLTDVHEDSPLGEVAAVVDVLQTPAFLCRQTNFIVAVCSQGKPVNIKKGQFLSPLGDAEIVVDKARSTGNSGDHGVRARVLLRLQQSGQRTCALARRDARDLAAPVVFDATHSVQLPGGKGDASGGQREFVLRGARARSRRGRRRWPMSWRRIRTRPNERSRTARMRGRSIA